MTPFVRIIRPLASLKLTVTLFAMSVFLIFAGTLAQVDRGIWTIMDEYFRTFLAWIDLRIFFPRSWDIPAVRFPFPGGWLIGGVLLANLITAHSLLFTVKARGQRLLFGLFLLASGVVMTGLVLSGYFQQEIAATEGDAFWRVLIRLIQGGLGAIVLLVACIVLFGKRAGIVLLHGGIILLLVSEIITGLWAVESTMTLEEGETVDFVDLSQESELAVIDESGPAKDTVTVIPGSMLKRPGAVVSHELLPFDVELVEHFDNSQPPQPRDPANPAHARGPVDAGIGLEAYMQPKPEGTGVGDMQRDAPGIIATFKDKKTGAKIGTYVLSYWFYPNFVNRSWDFPQHIEAGGKSYTLYYRPQRVYKPYALHLVDFRHDVYVGTNTPKDYSSFVKILDPAGNELREVRIWMNNPLRYSGETFYQQAFIAGDKGTILQVVKNVGWMVPYVACMIVATGMIAHMGSHLFTFLKRRLGA